MVTYNLSVMKYGNKEYENVYESSLEVTLNLIWIYLYSLIFLLTVKMTWDDSDDLWRSIINFAEMPRKAQNNTWKHVSWYINIFFLCCKKKILLTIHYIVIQNLNFCSQ